MNPFGVGAAGATVERVKGRCECCSLPFLYETWRGNRVRPPQWCDYCASHFPQPDEPVERELERLRSHEHRLRAWALAASNAATEAEAQSRTAAEEVRSARRGSARALEERDAWRSLLREMWAEHI